MKVSQYFPHAVVLVLLAMSGVFRSPAFAYASVLALAAMFANDALEYFKDIHAKRNAPVEDALRKKLIDVEARITTIEYGIKQRGF